MANNVVIKVTPSELRGVATKIRTQAEDYAKQYTQLFSDVDGMANAWKGKDNTAFTNQIKGFLDDFQSMKTLLEEYATFLDKSANAYEQTQDEITSAAQRLQN
jgi:WXG100 family type VII secretion target